MTGPLYDRDTGLISAAGMAVLAGVDPSLVTSLPGATDSAVPAVEFPETLIRRSRLNIARALRAGVGTDVFDIIDWLAARQEATR